MLKSVIKRFLKSLVAELGEQNLQSPQKSQCSSLLFIGVVYRCGSAGKMAEANAANEKTGCVFCDIASGKSDGEVVYSDDDYICFRDIKPHASHHYLVIPKKHYGNAKYLQSEQCSVIERMYEIGKQVITEKNCDLSDCRFGFHWPPFQSIEHLHLHALGPLSSMSFLSKRMVFRHNYPFVTVDWTLEYLLRNKTENKST